MRLWLYRLYGVSLSLDGTILVWYRARSGTNITGLSQAALTADLTTMQLSLFRDLEVHRNELEAVRPGSPPACDHILEKALAQWALKYCKVSQSVAGSVN